MTILTAVIPQLLFQSKWQLVALICAAFPAVSAVLIFFLLPESPVWLVSKKRNEDATKALMYINCTTKPNHVEEELRVLAEHAQRNPKQSLSLPMTLKALTKPETYKPLILMNTFFFFQVCTGTFVFTFYTVSK